MFDRINNLVAKDGFTLLIWNDRYGKGVRAGLGIVHSDMDTVSSLYSLWSTLTSHAIEALNQESTEYSQLNRQLAPHPPKK
ncbi:MULTISPECIES: hypothetical protein [Pseudomonas]|uniref:Uncharacterized protein n=1 Tax=Pseudomonas luteola TaxID=47886 RepID=A0ABS0MXI4_PSELU|nr:MULTISPECIES: hypothetical protein [Pseudomonas]MBA1250294.1 hypothetical protein [Pseudomonas zeshuii]MBH3441417.1 hypothetical protein [Pseudomonas luteola]RRW40333.1 hypothetical protein EGJ50_24700 [Pseudomonas luteola]